MRLLFLIGLSLAIQKLVCAELNLVGIFGDSMVVQRDEPIAVWGTNDPGKSVIVSFANNTNSVDTNEDGTWQATLPAMAVSEKGRSLTVRSGGQTLVVRDVVVGDVWHASGQSNMAMTVGAVANRLKEAQTDIEKASFPDIRFRPIRESASKVPRDDIHKQNWIECSSKSASGFSAVVFYFAREVHQAVGVPIGVVESSRGGTPIEPFIPRSAFHSHPTLQRELELGDADNLQEIAALPGGVFARDGNWLPGRLFHSRIAPIRRFPVRGLIWYQAESNCGKGEDPRDYQHKMRALIVGWRAELNRPNMPIYYVQLPGYGNAEAWPYMREQQRLSMGAANTGMAVTIDLIDQDIHPANKIDVGKRLARWALAKTYGKPIPFSGPLFDRAVIENGQVTVHFQHVQSGLMTAKKQGTDEPMEVVGDQPNHIELVGSDGVWHRAVATIEDDTLVAKCDRVPEPIAIRYGYAANPQNCNLYNGDRLPASPFCSRPELLEFRMKNPHQ